MANAVGGTQPVSQVTDEQFDKLYDSVKTKLQDPKVLDYLYEYHALVSSMLENQIDPPQHEKAERHEGFSTLDRGAAYAILEGGKMPVASSSERGGVADSIEGNYSGDSKNFEQSEFPTTYNNDPVDRRQRAVDLLEKVDTALDRIISGSESPDRDAVGAVTSYVGYMNSEGGKLTDLRPMQVPTDRSPKPDCVKPEGFVFNMEAEVGKVQTYLIGKGYKGMEEADGTPIGQWGRITSRAFNEELKELQEKLGFEGKDVDGWYGPMTRAALRNHIEALESDENPTTEKKTEADNLKLLESGLNTLQDYFPPNQPNGGKENALDLVYNSASLKDAPCAQLNADSDPLKRPDPPKGTVSYVTP